MIFTINVLFNVNEKYYKIHHKKHNPATLKIDKDYEYKMYRQFRK